MNSPTEARSAPPRDDLSLNCVMRLASPKPVMHCMTQPSCACSGTWLCTNRVRALGVDPGSEQLRVGEERVGAQLGGVLLDGDRVQVDDQ